MAIKDRYETAGICVICIILHYIVLYYITSPQIEFEPERPIQVVYISANSLTLFQDARLATMKPVLTKAVYPSFQVHVTFRNWIWQVSVIVEMRFLWGKVIDSSNTCIYLSTSPPMAIFGVALWLIGVIGCSCNVLYNISRGARGMCLRMLYLPV